MIKMNKFCIFTVLLISLFIFCGCNKTSDDSTNKKEILNFSFSNEPRFKIFNEKDSNIKFGYIDKNGKVVIEPKYVGAFDFIDGVAQVAIAKDNSYYYGLIDVNGKGILKFEYDNILPFSENLAAVSSNDKYGYVNKKGKFVIWPKYDDAYSFRSGVARVVVDDKVGYIDKSGKYLIYPKYSRMYSNDFIGNYTIVEKNGKFSVINKKDELIKVLNYDSVYYFSNDTYVAYRGSKSGLINSVGKEILPLNYNVLLTCDDSNFFVFSTDGKKFGVMDKNLKLILPEKFSVVPLVNQGIIIASDNGKIVIFDKKGKQIAKSEFKLFGKYSDGYIAVSKDEHSSYGYIDKTGKIVIEPKYFVGGFFINGLASVEEKTDNKYIIGYINTKGEYVWKNETVIEKDESQYQEQNEYSNEYSENNYSSNNSYDDGSNYQKTNSSNYNHADVYEAESDILN